MKTTLFFLFVTVQMLAGKLNNYNLTDSLVQKQAGICFRSDDNAKSYKIFAFADILNKHNVHGTFAINMGNYQFDSKGYVDSLRRLQDEGHEILDHTPNHKTNYFTTRFDSLDYVDTTTGNPVAGVDHILRYSPTKFKICLEFNQPDTANSSHKGFCDINGDTLTGDFSNIDFFHEIYIYMPSIDAFVYIKSIDSSKTKAIVKDLWEDSIDLGQHTNIAYYSLNRQHRLSVDGIKMLAKETLKLTEFFGFQRTYSFIQPGGRHPIFTDLEIKEAVEDLGYICGASEPKSALKVFNEYDPNDTKRFGMEWGDFFEDYKIWTVDSIKNRLADNIGRHQVSVGHDHLDSLKNSNTYVSLEEYLQKVDSLLTWCDTNNIPVRTYAEWAKILYVDTPNPYQNIFPSLSVNTDSYSDSLNPNGFPDGFYPRTNINHGIWGTDTTATDSIVYCYSSMNWKSRIFLAYKISGIEKGENDFEIMTKGGGDLDTIKVIFSFTTSRTPSTTFTFPSNTEEWTKYDLSNSLNDNKVLTVPDSADFINIEVRTTNHYSPNPIKVTGMFLGKKEITSVENIDAGLPNSFLLSQNYPNPFNPSTKINYSLPVRSNVKLKVYNILGSEVATLVNKMQNAGNYEVNFDGSNLASGVYFLTINAKNFFQTRKMILLK